MCHGPGSLKRMNPNATSEKETDNKEYLATKTGNNTGVTEVEVIIKDNLEMSEKIRKNVHFHSTLC